MANSPVLLGNPWEEITARGQAEGIVRKKTPESLKEKSGKEGLGYFFLKKNQLVYLRLQKFYFAFSCKIC